MRKKGRIILFSILLLTLPYTSGSQTIIPDFKNLNVEQGLSQSSVYSIFQDKEGYMWFGTADGINRYDGEYIEVYKTMDGTISNNAAKGTIAEDSRNNIWFSTETGLYMIDRLRNTVVKKFSFARLVNISNQFKIQFIHNDTIWMFHSVKGACCYSIQNNSFKSFPLPLLLNAINSTIVYAKSDFPFIWVSQFSEKTVCKFDVRLCQYKTVVVNGEEWLHYKKEGNLSFLFTLSHIQIFNDQNRQIAKLSLGSYNDQNMIIGDIAKDNYNRLWIATLNKGLMMYDFATGNVKAYEHDNSKLHTLPINLVNCLYIDRNDNLWIGTDGGGVCRIDLKPSVINKFPLSEGDYPQLNDYFTKCFYEDAKGNVWFGTHNNGFCIFNPQNRQMENIRSINGKKLMAVGDIIKDDDQHLWIGHGSGVARYDITNKKFYELSVRTYYPIPTGIIYIYRFLRRKKGDLVAATSQTLLHIYATGKKSFATNAMMNGTRNFPAIITDIKELPDNNLVFTAPGNGLYIIDSNLNEVHVIKRFLNDVDLRCISLSNSKANHIWVGSGNGLIDLNYQTGEYKIYNRSNGFSNDYIYSILPDSNHNLWMSTNGGIVVFNPQTGFVKNFTVSDGLQSNEFNTGAYYKSANGNFYFGGIKGFNWMKTEALNVGKTYPPVFVSQIFINNQFYQKDTGWNNNKTLFLNYNENDLFFRVSVLDYTKPEANKIWYKLQGWDKKPVITNIKEIRYNNLPPGDYKFIIKAANWTGAWSDDNMQIIHIKIKSPFWKTWWFYTLLGLIVATVVIAVTNYISQNKLKEKLRELEKQKEIDKERQRISREMHDDIGAGLTQITLMSESVRTKMPAKELDDIAGTSRTLISNMSEIIWSLNQENKFLDRLIAYLREELHKQLEYSGMEYLIELPDGGQDIILNNEQRRNILLVCKEIVNNAIKYSCATHLSVYGILKENNLYFKISDNGKGFNTVKSYPGNGLKNMRKRVEDIGSTMEIKSLPEEGAEFSFCIPIGTTT